MTIDKADNMRCLELTANLVSAAIQSGKLESVDGQTVADFFSTVHARIYECYQMDSSELIAVLSKNNLYHHR